MLVGFDCETHLLTAHNVVPRVVCLSLASRDLSGLLGPPPEGVLVAPGRLDPRVETRLYPRGPAALDAAVRVLEAAAAGEVEAVAHEAVYDVACLARLAEELAPLGQEEGASRAILRPWAGAVESGCATDTRWRERLIRIATVGLERPKASLARLVRDYLGVDRSAEKDDPDAWRRRYSELDGVPLEDWPRAAADYALADAEDAILVASAQVATAPWTVDVAGTPARLTDGRRVVYEDREVAAATALGFQARWGLVADGSRVEEVLAAWEEVAEEGVRIGQAHGFVRQTGARNLKALRARVKAAYLARGTEPPRTPKGAVRYGREQLQASGDPVLEDYAETTEYAGHLSRYGPILRSAGAAGRPVIYRPDVCKRTGRTSIAQPPFQQPPRRGGFRSCFVPRPGWLFVSVDYDYAELCSLAQICESLGLGSAMADAIRAGSDLHARFGAQILDRISTYPAPPEGSRWTESLLQEARKGAHGDALREAADEARDFAKILNFGLPGRMVGPTLSKQAATRTGRDLPVDLAEELAALWHGEHPEVKALFRWVDAHIHPLTGEGAILQPVSGRIRAAARATSASNTLFQGLVADGAKYAAWLLWKAAYLGEGHERAADFYGCRPVLFLHDEILAEVPEDRASEAADAMAAIMVDAMQRHHPTVPIRAAPAVMDRWHKGAKEVRDEDGVLQIWRPS